MNHAARVAALAGSLDLPLLVTRLPNIRYLTGFAGSSAYLLVRPDGTGVFVTDGRYGEAADPLVGALGAVELVVYTGGLWDTLSGILPNGGRVGLEEGGVDWEFVRTLGQKTSVEAVPTRRLVERLRRVKDPDEIESLRKAAAAGDSAFAALSELAAGSATEADLAWALTDAMRRRGGKPAGWDPIVAAGAGASVPHHSSGEVPLGGGLLLLDFGCTVDGYHSDMSRTVWLGSGPGGEMGRVYRAVAEAQQTGIDAIAPGAGCGAVDAAVREVLRGYGYEEQFLHSTGHGVGLEIHEEPWVRKDNDDLLEVGNVVTVEPGVYVAGIGGVRIEDMVLVTEEGPVVLTESPRELMTI